MLNLMKICSMMNRMRTRRLWTVLNMQKRNLTQKCPLHRNSKEMVIHLWSMILIPMLYRPKLIQWHSKIWKNLRALVFATSKIKSVVMDFPRKKKAITKSQRRRNPSRNLATLLVKRAQIKSMSRLMLVWQVLLQEFQFLIQLLQMIYSTKKLN